MPFKSAERARQWNREYQQKRDAHARVERVALEETILRTVLTEPCRHDVLSLYARLREHEIPLAAVTRTVTRLLRDHVCYWAGHTNEKTGAYTPGLALSSRAREVFASPGGRPEEERADTPTEGTR